METSKVLCFSGGQAISPYDLVIYVLSGQKRFVWVTKILEYMHTMEEVVVVVVAMHGENQPLIIHELVKNSRLFKSF